MAGATSCGFRRPAVTETARRTSLLLSKGLACTDAFGPLSASARGLLRHGALLPLTRRLAASPTTERRALGEMLTAAVEQENWEAVRKLVSTAGRRADLGTEKILSRRYRFLWLGVPKAASRSLIAALRKVDPEARLIRGLSLDSLLRSHPEVRCYFSFAFLRHPCSRVLSFYADKHVGKCTDRDARRWFVEPWHGLYPGMRFEALCRWLDTPCGADAFADRHWLSQSRQVLGAGGTAPDFLGRCETLEDDWHELRLRLGLPAVPLPRRNSGPYEAMAPVRLGADILCLLRRRYAQDYELGGYGEAPPTWPW